MKKIVVFLSMFFFVFFTACINNSDWGKVVIPANQTLVFSVADNPLDNYEKHVFVKVGENDMFLTNRNLVWRICYLKMAFPDKDITIEYVKIEEDGKTKLDPRFINIE